MSRQVGETKLSVYLEQVTSALKTLNACASYFPMDKGLRRERNLKLGREIGYGIAGCDGDPGPYLGTLYGRMIVAHSFDSTGVMIDNAAWIKAIKAGIAKHDSARVRVP